MGVAVSAPSVTNVISWRGRAHKIMYETFALAVVLVHKTHAPLLVSVVVRAHLEQHRRVADGAQDHARVRWIWVRLKTTGCVKRIDHGGSGLRPCGGVIRSKDVDCWRIRRRRRRRRRRAGRKVNLICVSWLSRHVQARCASNRVVLQTEQALSDRVSVRGVLDHREA